MKSNYYISYLKEQNDSQKLVDIIKENGWASKDMIIVNCFPEYSSRLSHFINHKLSYLNRNELYEIINIQMPYPNTNQVWDQCSGSYKNFDTYLKDWTNDLFSGKFLFVLSNIKDNKSYNKIRLNIRKSLKNEDFRFAALYKSEDITIPPDYLVEEVVSDRNLFFQWENTNNPNWK